MYTISPSVTDITQTDFTMDGVLRHIERCAHVCYKSESKMSNTADGSRAFVCRLIERGHLRPLEFGTVYLCNCMDRWPRNRLNMPPWLQYVETSIYKGEPSTSLFVSVDELELCGSRQAQDAPAAPQQAQYHQGDASARATTDELPF